MFKGMSALNLDGKGRLSVPARHREVLAALCGGQLTITRHPDGCLIMFPRTEWEKFSALFESFPMELHGWKRFFLGNAVDVELDSAGRVLISPELREAAKLEHEVVLMGTGRHFELWNKAAHKAQEDKTLENAAPAVVRELLF